MLIMLFLSTVIFLTSLYLCKWPSVPQIYNGIWLIAFLLIFFKGSLDSVDLSVYILIVVLGLTFIIIERTMSKIRLPEGKQTVDRGLVKFYTLIAGVLIFLFFFLLSRLTSTGIGLELLYDIRYITLQNGGNLGILSFVGLALNFFMVTIVQYRNFVNKWLLLILITVVFLAQFFSGSRTNMLLFICSLLIMYWSTSKKRNLLINTLSVLCVVGSFSLSSWLRTAEYSDEKLNFVKIFAKFFDGLYLYLGSGVIAFSQIKSSMISGIGENYVWLNMLRVLGVGEITRSDSILPYVYIPEPTNIYSFILPYYLYGQWLFVLLSMLMISFLLSFLFNLGKNGSGFGLFIYAFGAAVIVQTPIGDGFLTSFPMWLLVLSYGACIYGILPMLRRRL